MHNLSISLQNVSYRPFGERVIDNLSLASQADRIALVGCNGSGKSSLVKLLVGLIKPSSGKLSVNGFEPARERRLAIDNIGVTFQNPDRQIIFPTVREELAFGLKERGLSSAEAEQQALFLLRKYQREHWFNKPCEQLSQGQKQLLCVLSVLMLKPKLLIMDEPFSGLDIPTRLQLQRWIEALPIHQILVTHDPAAIAHYSEVIWLEQGQLKLQGSAEEVLPHYQDFMQRLGELNAGLGFTL